MFSQLVNVRLAIGLAAILVLMSSGCSRGSKITKANADKIKIGMSENEVSDLLGNPSESAEVVVPRMGLVFEKAFDGMGPDRVTVKQTTWKEKDQVILVQYFQGKVVSRSFLDESKKMPEDPKKAADLKWARETAIDFLTAINSGKTAAAASLLTDDFRKAGEKQSNFLSRPQFGWPAPDNFAPKITKEEMSPDGNEVSIRGTVNDPRQSFTVRVIKEKDGGKWRVNFFTF
jgi:outer membrane protein assembly factor BamE (lipoprotein component of BamABCDE complex)